jgi:hypothetical protein
VGSGKDNPSLNSNFFNFTGFVCSQKAFKALFSLNKYKCNGDCSLMVERSVVVRMTGVRFTPFALALFKKDLGENPDFEMESFSNKSFRGPIW